MTEKGKVHRDSSIRRRQQTGEFAEVGPKSPNTHHTVHQLVATSFLCVSRGVKMVRFGAPSPKAFIEKLAANDAATTSVDLSESHSRPPVRLWRHAWLFVGNNALFKMKTFEYLEKIAEAMKNNTVVRAIRVRLIFARRVPGSHAARDTQSRRRSARS